MQNKKEIGRLFIKLLKFIPFLFIVYTIFLFVLEYSNPRYFSGNINYRIATLGHAFTRFKEVKNYGKVDILFLGSSHTYRGFDVRIFEEKGFKTFNLGSSSQTPIQTKVLLDRYIDLLDPKFVIYEVNLPDFSSDGVEASLDVIANDRLDWRALKMALEINNLKTYNTLIFGFLYELLGYKDLQSEPVEKLNDKYISGGYVEKKLKYYKNLNRRLRGVVLNQSQLIKFKEIVKEIKERGIQLYLVQAPMTTGYYNSITNADAFDSLMQTFGTYVNFNNVLDMNDTLHFFDAHHLNQLGVVKFNNDLIERFFDNERKSNNN